MKQRTNRQEKLLAWVKEMHGDQKRKYTGDPYWIHLISVGEMAESAGVELGWEIGVLHDILEDTPVEFIQLGVKLVDDLSYGFFDGLKIRDMVMFLTDEFTKENYPKLNRKQRKEYEAQRLWRIPPDAQTVKYCDIIDNAGSIMAFDPGFAAVYLREKERILEGMIAGDKELYQQAKTIANGSNT